MAATFPQRIVLHDFLANRPIAAASDDVFFYAIDTGEWFESDGNSWIELTSSGPQGSQGFQGDAGAQGMQGSQGPQGAQGETGAQGAQGAQGTTGATGSQGSQGFTGAQGSTGNQGATGAQGSNGAQGATGGQGAQGDVGAAGAQGVPGSQGPQGADGAQGIQGAQGVQGAQGATGATPALGSSSPLMDGAAAAGADVNASHQDHVHPTDTSRSPLAGTVGGPAKIIRRTGDSTARNSTNTGNTLTNDDTLLWAIGTNEVWWFDLYLLVNAANATMDIKLQWSVPTGATMTWGGLGTNTNCTWANAPVSGSPNAFLTAGSIPSFGTLAGSTGYIFTGVVVADGTHTGNVTLQWAQNTSDAGNLVLLANSFIKATRFA